MTKKLYAYIDESGQDTKGLLFVVSVLVLEKEGEILKKELEKIEKESGKGNVKWNKARRENRQKYIDAVCNLDILRGKIFFEVFGDTKKYLKLTSYATAKAILKRGGQDYKVTVFVDGLKKGEIAAFTRGLRDLHVKTRKIRGVKRDENNIFIRLVDSICGLMRDSGEKEEWSVGSKAKLKKKKILTEL